VPGLGKAVRVAASLTLVDGYMCTVRVVCLLMLQVAQSHSIVPPDSP
jgi:hypothetical protein